MIFGTPQHRFVLNAAINSIYFRPNFYKTPGATWQKVNNADFTFDDC